MIKTVMDVVILQNIKALFLFLKPNESAYVRFLVEPSEMKRLRRHYVRMPNFKGYINCLKSDAGEGNCILCNTEECGWDARVAQGRNYYMGIVLDRSDNKVKCFEGGESLKNIYEGFAQANGGLTSIDFTIARGNGKDLNNFYRLMPMFSSKRPLTDEEKNRVTELDMETVLNRGKKTSEEVLQILEINNPSKS